MGAMGTIYHTGCSGRCTETQEWRCTEICELRKALSPRCGVKAVVICSTVGPWYSASAGIVGAVAAIGTSARFFPAARNEGASAAGTSTCTPESLASAHWQRPSRHLLLCGREATLWPWRI